MRTLTIRDVIIGEGMPKICIPLTGKGHEQIIEDARRALDARADICEWRADFFGALLSTDVLEKTLCALRELLGSVPLLFTIRTRAEGGQAALAMHDYAHINECAARVADLVDVELFTPGVEELIKRVKAMGARVIASSHDFEKTPTAQEMRARIVRMRDIGADIAKLAVTPHTAQDVLRLLEVTDAAAREDAAPVVTMAMGRLGGISRLAGETFGSAITFGSAGVSSAPGQIDALTLRAALEALHKA